MGFQRFLLSRCTHWSAYYTTTPQNAQEASIAWTTSDPEIAEVDEKGLVTFNSVEDNSEEIAGRKAQLSEYVTAASRDLATGKYTSATVKALKTRIAEANTVLDDRKATVRDIYMAQVRLLRAQQALTKKSANTLEVKGKTIKLKAKKLKKKAQTVKQAKAVTVKGPCGKVRYTLAGVSKAKFKKYFKVNAKTGKIKVRKGLKKGTYTVKINVSASGDGNYLPAAKTVKVIVNVR